MKDRKSFVIHIDSLAVLDELDDMQVAALFRAIKAYHTTVYSRINEDTTVYERIPTDTTILGGIDGILTDKVVKIAFLTFKNQFERDAEKYITTCQKNAENVAKRWKKNTTGKNGKKKYTKHTDSDSKSDSKSKSDSDSKNKNNKIITEQSSVYEISMDCYHKFFISVSGSPPNITGRSGKSMKRIIAYCERLAGSDNKQLVVSKVREIFDGFQYWDEFHKKQLELHQIEANINNIVAAINAAKPKPQKEYSGWND
jgi:hypothetical protein